MVRRHAHKPRVRHDEQTRQGARFLPAADRMTHLVGSRGALAAPAAPKAAPSAPSRGIAKRDGPSEAQKARQQRKKQRRRERWEASLAERGEAVRRSELGP